MTIAEMGKEIACQCRLIDSLNERVWELEAEIWRKNERILWGDSKIKIHKEEIEGLEKRLHAFESRHF